MKLSLATLALFLTACATTPAATPLQKGDRVVFLGDSITQAGVRPDGYVTLVSEAIAKAHPDLGVEVIGAGISGHRVPDCQKRLKRDVLDKKPTVVLIYIGINDVWHWTHPNTRKRGGTKAEDFDKGLRDMIEKINAVGARVILCTPTLIGEKKDRANAQDKMLDQYSDISRKVAKETKSQMLDLRQAFQDYVQKHNEKNASRGVLTSDTVHLNRTGNRFLASLVLKALGVPVQKPDSK